MHLTPISLERFQAALVTRRVLCIVCVLCQLKRRCDIQSPVSHDGQGETQTTEITLSKVSVCVTFHIAQITFMFEVESGKTKLNVQEKHKLADLVSILGSDVVCKL